MIVRTTVGSLPRRAVTSSLSLLLLIAVMVSIQAATLPDLSGKYRINRELSDNAQEKLDNALINSSTIGPRSGNIGPRADARDRERAETRQRIEALINASETLNITQGKNEVTIAEGNLRERKFYTDGRAYQQPDRRGNLTTLRARWQGDRLVVNTRLADGGKFTESYELAPGGRQLFVTVTSQDRRLKQPLVIRRVYDLEKPAAR